MFSLKMAHHLCGKQTNVTPKIQPNFGQQWTVNIGNYVKLFVHRDKVCYLRFPCHYCTAITAEKEDARSPGGSTVSFRYYLLGGDTAVPSGQYARLCHIFLVVTVLQRRRMQVGACRRRWMSIRWRMSWMLSRNSEPTPRRLGSASTKNSQMPPTTPRRSKRFVVNLRSFLASVIFLALSFHRLCPQSFDNYTTLTFDLLISGSVHAEQLLCTVCLPCLLLTAQVVFFLDCGHLHTEAITQSHMPPITLSAGVTVKSF